MRTGPSVRCAKARNAMPVPASAKPFATVRRVTAPLTQRDGGGWSVEWRDMGGSWNRTSMHLAYDHDAVNPGSSCARLQGLSDGIRQASSPCATVG